MPQIHDPTTRGSSSSGNRIIAKRSRRRRKKDAAASSSPAVSSNDNAIKTPPQQQEFLGGDLLDFCKSVEAKESSSSSSSSEIMTTEKESSEKVQQAGLVERNRHDEPNHRHPPRNESSSSSFFSTLALLPVAAFQQQQHALAMDTRYLDTPQGKQEHEIIRSECHRFLQSLQCRGVLPRWLSWTEELQRPVSNKKTARAKMPILGIHISDSSSTTTTTGRRGRWNKETSISSVPMIGNATTSTTTTSTTTTTTANNNKDNKHTTAQQLPKGLRAHASWKLFGDFVDSILEEYKNSHDHYHSTTTTTVIPPLDITILTNDICFLSDINQASHKRAIHTFWDRVKPNFLESKIRNLHIIVISTDSVVVVENDDADDDDDDDKGNNNVDNDQEEEEGDPRSDAPATSSSSSNHEEEGETTEMLERKRAISIAKLMNTMSQLLDTKCEAEFKENKSCIQFDVAHHHTPAINIQLSTIDNTSVGFNALLRRWSRDMLSGHGRVVRLTLDLPETSAFSECSVSLDASLPMVPFGRLDSDLSRRLLTDLKFLSQSKLEVVQLVPIESIDAALLFGVAIGVRAGLEHDPDQHNEMGLLVRTLFKQLAQRDCALLLRSSKGPNQYPEKEEEKGLFHSPEAQSWLLMAGEVPTPLKGQTAPNSGVLYRMATADHFIEDVMLGPGDIIASDEDDAFVEFVEASLDSLGCSPVNPLYLQSKSNQRKKPFRTLTCNKFTKSQERVWSSDDNNNKEACDVSMGKAATVQRTASLAVTRGGDSNDRDNKVIGWNDDFGVGSMARVFSQESEDSKGGKSPRNYETPKIPTRKVRNELIAKIVSSSKTPIDDDDVEWSDGGGKAVGWNDHSGVGSVARRFSQGSEDQKEKGNESLRNTRKIATKQSRKKVITVKQQNDDEAEWTDGTSSCGFSSPDSGSVAGYSR